MAALEVESTIHGVKCWQNESEKLSTCEAACPIHMDIPAYIIAISRGRFKEAVDIMRETNPFPSVCGRVCHHPCEAECNRTVIDEPVAIQWLKRFAADYTMRERLLPEPCKRTKSQKIAIVGSGPAGLTAAYDLVKQGYPVCVYESGPLAGGVLATGIPEFVLPQDIVQSEVEYIRAMGVEIKTNIHVGTGLTIERVLEMGYKAVLIATGSGVSSTLPIPGIQLEGISYGLIMLENTKLGRCFRPKGKVIVIGGGNVAIDVARSAVRLGADEVHLACLEDRSSMPAFSWEIENAEKEGVKIHPSLAPQKMLTCNGKRVSGILFKPVTSTYFDQDGRLKWTLEDSPEYETTIVADNVIIAIGQKPDTSMAVDNRLEIAKSGNIISDPVSMSTSKPGVFACGDCVVGAGSVVGSIAAGHQAAASIIRYLGGEDKKRELPAEIFKLKSEMVPEFLMRKRRWSMPALAAPDAARCFDEAVLGYTERQAIEEAKRCLNCRMCGNCLFGHDQICGERSGDLL